MPTTSGLAPARQDRCCGHFAKAHCPLTVSGALPRSRAYSLSVFVLALFLAELVDVDSAFAESHIALMPFGRQEFCELLCGLLAHLAPLVVLSFQLKSKCIADDFRRLLG